MKIFASLLVSTLFMATTIARAEADSTDDLRYCLGLQSNYEIAKCAGEISPGSKGKPYSKQEVDKILSEEQASVPASTIESSATPATDSDNSNSDLLPEKNAGSSN